MTDDIEDVFPPQLERVLGRLSGVRKSLKGWTACCPAHDDRTPSLSIGLGIRVRLSTPSNRRLLRARKRGCVSMEELQNEPMSTLVAVKRTRTRDSLLGR